MLRRLLFVLFVLSSHSVAQAEVRAPRPANDRTQWVQASDWPLELIQRGITGSVRVNLEVDEQGRVAACTIARSSGYEAMDTVACARISERARFDPATNAAGEKIHGSYGTTVLFRFNDQRQAGPQQGEVSVAFIVEADGTVSDCVVDTTRRADGGQEPICPAGMSFEPYRNSAGQAVRTRVEVTNAVVVTQIP